MEEQTVLDAKQLENIVPQFQEPGDAEQLLVFGSMDQQVYSELYNTDGFDEESFAAKRLHEAALSDSDSDEDFDEFMSGKLNVPYEQEISSAYQKLDGMSLPGTPERDAVLADKWLSIQSERKALSVPKRRTLSRLSLSQSALRSMNVACDNQFDVDAASTDSSLDEIEFRISPAELVEPDHELNSSINEYNYLAMTEPDEYGSPSLFDRNELCNKSVSETPSVDMDGRHCPSPVFNLSETFASMSDIDEAGFDMFGRQAPSPLFDLEVQDLLQGEQMVEPSDYSDDVHGDYERVSGRMCPSPGVDEKHSVITEMLESSLIEPNDYVKENTEFNIDSGRRNPSPTFDIEALADDLGDLDLKTPIEAEYNMGNGMVVDLVEPSEYKADSFASEEAERESGRLCPSPAFDLNIGDSNTQAQEKMELLDPASYTKGLSFENEEQSESGRSCPSPTFDLDTVDQEEVAELTFETSVETVPTMRISAETAAVPKKLFADTPLGTPLTQPSKSIITKRLNGKDLLTPNIQNGESSDLTPGVMNQKQLRTMQDFRRTLAFATPK